MIWNVVCLAGSEDKFMPLESTPESTLIVPLSIPGHPDAVRSTVADEFARFGITPSVSAWDLLNATIAAYTADVRLPRRSGYDGWTREIALHLAVEHPEGWEVGKGLFERLLSFLTGDRWSVHVRPGHSSYTRQVSVKPKQQELNAQSVSLFSGGLDSFVGAIDLLEATGGQVALLGHHSLGGGPTSTSQRKAYNALLRSYPADRLPFLQLWVSPPKGTHRASEITTRGRSVLFLGLGVAAASGLDPARLIVPENGVISLNVPLTDSRLGSLSTRTTHPYLVSLLRELLQALGIPVSVDLPYRFRTKGEMLSECRNQQALAAGLAETMSCARPGASRFSSARNANLHCGYCLPCLIRRSSAARMGTDPTRYFAADLHQPLSETRLADIRALKMALNRYASKPPRLADILLSGPLPGVDGDLVNYLAMFQRGIDELRNFMEKST